MISDGRAENLTGKCIYFARVNPRGVDVKTIETDIAYGEILGSPLASLQVVLQELFQVCFLAGPCGPPQLPRCVSSDSIIRKGTPNTVSIRAMVFIALYKLLNGKCAWLLFCTRSLFRFLSHAPLALS